MEVDLVPLSQLPSRYGIARSALYTRLKDLQLVPAKQGKKAFVNAEQLQLLDALHDHIQQGGTTGEFLKTQSRNPTGLSREASPVEVFPDSSGQISVLITVVEAIVKRLLPATGNRLSYLRELEEAYEKGWLLSTSEVAALLKLSPGTVRSYGESFEDAGFVFTRAGTRKGGEIAWAIDKETFFEPTPPASTPVVSGSLGIKEAFSSQFDPETE